MFTDSATSTTTTVPSTRVCCTSTPESGPKSISDSAGYCETNSRSAPRETIPMASSKTSGAAPMRGPKV